MVLIIVMILIYLLKVTYDTIIPWSWWYADVISLAERLLEWPSVCVCVCVCVCPRHIT